MSVELESKRRIENLVSTANEVTGNSDTDLTSAVNSLIDGFGGNDSAFADLVNGTIEHFVATSDMSKIREYLFYNTSLKTVDLSACNATIDRYAFYNNQSLESVVLPNWKDLSKPAPFGGRVFLNCSKLKQISSPYSFSVHSASPQLFENCVELTSAIFPKASFSGSAQVFKGCSNLAIVDYVGGTISPTMFQNCESLKIIVLRSPKLNSLSNVSAFDGTPFAEGGSGGIVYVQQALIEKYKIATNWATLYTAGTCNFVAIEGSEYE